MTIIVGCVSQKGGVGKSTVARMIAREYASAGWSVKIADLDSQGTSTAWKMRREQNGLEPVVAVEPFGTVAQAMRSAPHYDLLVFDVPPHGTAATLAVAKASQAVIIPTGLCLDDLVPTVLLAHELVRAGVDRGHIVFGLCRVGDSFKETLEARTYLKEAGYAVLPGALQEKTGYRRASDDGRAVTEATHPSLRAKAERFAQGVIDFIGKE